MAKAENESIDPLQKDWVLKANLNELKSARIKYPDSKFIGLINTRIGTITEIESGKLFKKIRNSYNLSELQGFLTKYPNVSKSNAVKGIVIELTKGYSEEKTFEQHNRHIHWFYTTVI
ncbi:MAG: hypothetical protein IPO33_17910 [Saprospiraceae bacterium]|nr:hypothetical protein [Candidatus Brachybacter algidus]